jgi:PknH-like extracellular domain
VPRLLLLLGVVAIAAGCARGTDGVARPARTAVTVLPSEDEMTSAVGNRLSSFGFQPFVGGLEIMPDGFRTDGDAAPIGCIGVTDTMMRVTYEPSDVLEAARQSYFNWSQGVGVSGADAAVVRLATTDDADRTFDRFVGQWRGCDGQTVLKHLRGVRNADLFAAVSDVTVAGRMLTAAVSTRQGPAAPVSHYRRALAVRGDTIVEVSLAVSDAEDGRAGSRDDAARAAQAMLDKVRGGS